MTTYTVNNTEQEQKLYAGREYEIDLTSNTAYNYIYAGNEPVAVYIQNDSNKLYYLHSVLNGSISYITDTEGNKVDTLSYTPFGQRRMFSDWSKTDTAKHLIDRGFTGQQHLDNFALINFNGRMYDPVLAHFLSPDPYIQSPENPLNHNRYSYCLFSPLQYVDPSGLLIDEWEINRFGKIVNHIVTDKHDAFYIVDDEGNRIEGKELIFPYGTIESHIERSYEYKGNVDFYDVFQIRGDENGKQFFEFYANVVNGEGIEVSHVKCGIEGNKGLNFVSTAHFKPYTETWEDGKQYRIASEPSLTYLWNGRLQYGYTIRAINHSHPLSADPSDSDLRFTSRMRQIYSDIKKTQAPNFNIFYVKENRYIAF